MIGDGNFNFDHPDAFDFDLAYSTLKALKSGKPAEIALFDPVANEK
jgi:uridine kinase